MRILLFLLDLFFSRSRCFKDEEMNRFSKRGDQLKTDGLPTLRNEAFKEEEEEELHHREECESLLSRRDKNANTRAARTRKRGSLNFKSTRAYAREREKEKEMNQTRIVKKRRRHHKRAPALASFCATNNPSNGLFLCHWRTLARFSIASSAASSNRKRQYACGLIDCSMW